MLSRVVPLFFVDGDLATLTGLCKWLASKWEAIGDRLGVPVGQLDAIRENNRGGGRDMCQRCLRDMLLWRLRNGKGVTAERLAKAVHDLGEHNTEANINKQFGELLNSLWGGGGGGGIQEFIQSTPV